MGEQFGTRKISLYYIRTYTVSIHTVSLPIMYRALKKKKKKPYSKYNFTEVFKTQTLKNIFSLVYSLSTRLFAPNNHGFFN